MSLPSKHVMSDVRIKQQREFIETKLKKCRLFDKYNLTLVDSNDIIITSLMGELRNIVLSFFKGGMYSEKKCEHCSTTESRQFERAHDVSKSRRDVALDALRRIRSDETKQIKQNDFMRAFIEEHCNVPLWILCKSCHTLYDKKEKSLEA